MRQDEFAQFPKKVSWCAEILPLINTDQKLIFTDLKLLGISLQISEDQNHSVFIRGKKSVPPPCRALPGPLIHAVAPSVA